MVSRRTPGGGHPELFLVRGYVGGCAGLSQTGKPLLPWFIEPRKKKFPTPSRVAHRWASGMYQYLVAVQTRALESDKQEKEKGKGSEGKEENVAPSGGS